MTFPVDWLDKFSIEEHDLKVKSTGQSNQAGIPRIAQGRASFVHESLSWHHGNLSRSGSNALFTPVLSSIFRERIRLLRQWLIGQLLDSSHDRHIKSKGGVVE